MLARILCQEDGTVQTDCNAPITDKRYIREVVESALRYFPPLPPLVLNEHLTTGAADPESFIARICGEDVGSDLIGQYWTSPRYFHGRPSATVNLNGTPSPYEADNSAASNLGPTSATLIKSVQQRVAELKKENPNAPPGPVPVDLVTTSGSGLDPDITVAAALYQVPRIAAERGLSQSVVQQLVMDHVHGRFLFIFGEPYINVLELNLALDGLK